MIKTNRVNAYAASPDSMKAMMGMEDLIQSSGLEFSLVELVKMRASQINGCAFCLDMHSKDAIEHGESPQRLFLLDAWRESSLFSERERAALAWTEALTLISTAHVSDTLFHEVSDQFNDEELTQLSVLVNQINAWNRIAISFQYQHPIDQAIDVEQPTH
jgi:AhpD family alkylhydroperoxidase